MHNNTLFHDEMVRQSHHAIQQHYQLTQFNGIKRNKSFDSDNRDFYKKFDEIGEYINNLGKEIEQDLKRFNLIKEDINLSSFNFTI